MKPVEPPRTCFGCRHFHHAPLELEAAFPGLSSLSSAYAAVRADDGVCAVHARYVTSASTCNAYVSRECSYDGVADAALA
jgi:hypothetical protein